MGKQERFLPLSKQGQYKPNLLYFTCVYRNSNCNDCPDCKARSSKSVDKCRVGRAESRIFYVVVWAHKNFNSLELDIDAANLKDVEGPL